MNSTTPPLSLLTVSVMQSDVPGTPASLGVHWSIDNSLLELTAQTRTLARGRWEREALHSFVLIKPMQFLQLVRSNFQPFGKIKLSALSSTSSSFRQTELHWERNPCGEQERAVRSQAIINHSGASSAHLTCRAPYPGMRGWLVTLKIPLSCRGIFPSRCMGLLMKMLETANLLCFDF